MKKTILTAALCALLLLVLCISVPDGQIIWEASDALYTDSALPPLTFSILPYGAGLAASALLAWAISFALSGKKIVLQDALCWFAWALALGLLLSRLVYCIIEPAYYNPKWLSRAAALRLWDGGMAMTGALAGILLAGRFSCAGAPLAPLAAPLFLVGARLSEMFTQLSFGPSVYFEGIWARKIGYSIRLNVSLIEATVALAIFFCILLLPRWAAKRRRALSSGHRVCAFLILYGVSQILMESLRKDRHMIWGFTKAQQIMALLMVFSALILLSKSAKEKRRMLAMSLCTAAPLVALEYALDKIDISIWLLYAAYLLVLIAYLRASWRVFVRALPPEE